MNPFKDPKVVIVMLGMLGSMSAWGTSLLMEVGELRASTAIISEQLDVLRHSHASEISKMHALIGEVMEACVVK